MTAIYSHIRTSIERHVAWIEFNRPPINAFNRAMVDETYSAVEAAIADREVRVLVLASALEKYFSAGADLNVFKGLSPEGVREWAVRCHAVARLLRGSPKPMLAAIHGIAVGGVLIDAAQALDWELVSELVEPAQLRAHVQAYAERLAEKSPAALAAIRRTITLGGGMSFEDGLACELEAVAALGAGPDFAEGVDAFLAKRPARWHRD